MTEFYHRTHSHLVHQKNTPSCTWWSCRTLQSWSVWDISSFAQHWPYYRTKNSSRWRWWRYFFRRLSLLPTILSLLSWVLFRRYLFNRIVEMKSWNVHQTEFTNLPSLTISNSESELEFASHLHESILITFSLAPSVRKETAKYYKNGENSEDKRMHQTSKKSRQKGHKILKCYAWNIIDTIVVSKAYQSDDYSTLILVAFQRNKK